MKNPDGKAVAALQPQEKFLETGVHPEIERQQREAAGDTGYVSLPDHDQHRPFVFWDLTIDNKPAGAPMRSWQAGPAPTAIRRGWGRPGRRAQHVARAPGGGGGV
jgi:hypothetical protein